MPLPHLLNDITNYCVHYPNKRKSRDFLQYKKGSKIYYVAISEKKRLRVAECKHREFGDKSEKLDFLTFCQEKPWSFRELISMRPI